jgi:hypothetical protein
MDEHDRSQELVRVVAEEVTPKVSRFMGTIVGSPSIEVSELVSERIRAWRFKRQIKAIQRAQEQLEEAGMDPKTVPLRTLAPLIEGASLEDDDEMVERWASLLANAAGDGDVPPSFPNVLRELEPSDARVLDLAYGLLMQLGPPLRLKMGAKREAMLRESGLDEARYDYHVDNLIRLRLLRPMISLNGDPDSSSVMLTEFGQAFVRSCLPPGTSDPEITIPDQEALDRMKQEAEERKQREAEAQSAEADGNES